MGERDAAMADTLHGPGCGFCGKSVVKRDGGGRPRDYCDKVCRRRARRKRDAERRAALPRFTHRLIASELALRAEELLTACVDNAPLGEVLGLAARIADDADCLAAAAVAEERSAGKSWAEVAAAAQVSEGSARARWGGVRGARRLAYRNPMPWAGRSYGAPRCASVGERRSAEVAQRSAAALARALRTVYDQSEVRLGEVADEAGMPLSVVREVLEGQILAPWPVTFMLAHLLGGQPRDLRLLWDTAARPPIRRLRSRHSMVHLGAGMRGAWLAAGCPATAAVCPPGLDEAETDAVFAGRLVPQWSVLCEILAQLQIDPDPFEEVWAACITADDGGRFR